MNFLAHFHLAWPDEGLLAGGLEGDYCKGPLQGGLPRSIEQGVILHRRIDAYTDSHPLVEELRAQFPSNLRRYAGILIDIAFDHYLTLHWAVFSTQSLKAFNSSVYQTLHEQEAFLSAGSRRMIKRLIDYDILNAYHHWEAVPETACRVGERFRHSNPLLETHDALDSLRPQLEAVFLNFYPQLQNFCQQISSEFAHQNAEK